MGPEDEKQFCKAVLANIAAFHWAARTKSISATAQRLNISGPRVGQIIRKLEEELAQHLNQGTLIDHSKKTIVPTEAGLLLYDFAETLLEMCGKLVDDIHQLQHSNEVRLATIQSSWVAHGPFIKHRFSELLPGGTIRDKVIGGLAYSDQIIAAINERSADVGITSFPPQVDEPLILQPLEELEFVLVFSPEYEYLPRSRRPVRPRDIVKTDPMLKVGIHDLKLDSPLTNTVVPYLRITGAFPGNSRLAERATIEDIKATVKAFPDTCAILPVDSVANDVRKRLLVAYHLSPPPKPWRWGLIYRSGTSRIAVQRFIESMRPFFKKPLKKSTHRS
jgi:DNA-binding transcriptional LysR family regulator